MNITKKTLKTLKRDKEFLIIGIKENNTDLLIRKYDIRSKEVATDRHTVKFTEELLAKIQMRLDGNRRLMRETQVEINLLTELINL